MNIREALIRLMETDQPATTGRCNCENMNCDHGESACKRPAGQRKAMYVGAICDQCVSKMPKQYMKEEDDDEDKPLGANPLEPKAASTGQATTRPLGATSVTARPQAGLSAAPGQAQKGMTMPAYQKNKQPGKPPPPSKNKQNWDMTQDFLKQHGMNLRGQKVAPTKVSGGPGGDIGPGYPGKFVGQVWDTSRVEPKNVSWKDKETGDRKYGKVQGKGVNRMVWDGQAWVTDDEFTKKFGKKAEESVREGLIRRMVEAVYDPVLKALEQSLIRAGMDPTKAKDETEETRDDLIDRFSDEEIIKHIRTKINSVQKGGWVAQKEANFPWQKFDPNQKGKTRLQQPPGETDHSTDAKLGFGDGSGEKKVDWEDVKSRLPSAAFNFDRAFGPDAAKRFDFSYGGKGVIATSKKNPDMKYTWDVSDRSKGWQQFDPKEPPPGFDENRKLGEDHVYRDSQEFAEDNPKIDPKVADKILKKHGMEMKDYFLDNPQEKNVPLIDTQNLLGWMGY